jgi:hypothetical protein
MATHKKLMPPNVLKALVSASGPRSSNGCAGGDRRRVMFVLILALWSASNVPAVDLPAGTNSLSQSDSDARPVKKLNNPISSQSSLALHNFDPGVGASSGGFQYKLNVQPGIPVFLNTNLRLIDRIILPFIHEQDVAEIGATETGPGDTTASSFPSPTEPGPGGLIRFPNDS